MDDSGLPIVEVADEIASAVATDHAVVLKAPPGAGKTTGVVPILCEHPATAAAIRDARIWLIQPRRLAARTAAERLAGHFGDTVGGRVGYHVRHDKRVGANTRVIVMTTGMAVRRLAADPYAETVDLLILDEFHERSWEMDLLFAWSLRLRGTIRDDLQLIIMSATLDPDPIVDHIRASNVDAIAVTSRGRSFPVDIKHHDLGSHRSPHHRHRGEPGDSAIQKIIELIRCESDGDVLVFLPGVGEINRLHRSIDGVLPGNCQVRILHGGLKPDQQRAALRRASTSDHSPPTRRVFLATNVAETSLTIDGVTMVIDTGTARVSRFDPSTGLPRLELEPISIASADQRAGRAGRTAPGTAHRLWGRTAHWHRKPGDVPEILRTDLIPVRLQMFAWGETDATDFPWLDPPPTTAVVTADDALRRIGAIRDDAITSLGRRLIAMPVHPRLGAMLVHSIGTDFESDAVRVASMLGDIDLIDRRDNRIDLVQRLQTIQQRWDSSDSPWPMFRQNVRQLQRAIAGGTRSSGPPIETTDETLAETHAETRVETLGRAVAWAMSDRICRRRESGSDRGVMVGGRGVRLPADRHGITTLDRSEYFVALDVDDREAEARVRIAMPIDASDLPPWRIRQSIRHSILDDGSVRSRRVRSFDDLVLDEVPIQTEPDDRLQKLLVDTAMQRIDAIIPHDGAFAALRTRIDFARRHAPDAFVLAINEGWIRDVISEIGDAKSLERFKRIDWTSRLRAELDYPAMRRLDQLAPEVWVPVSKSRWARQAIIEYPIVDDDAAEVPPRVTTRMQSVYGITRHPTVADGRVPIQFHLTSPADRVIQITDDLPGFFAGNYELVRKDMKSRYPKHHWPADPVADTTE